MSNAEGPIGRADVRRIAELAHLALTEDEQLRMVRELGTILAYVDQLRELDVDEVPPTAHVLLDASPLRDDVPVPSLSQELALREAPKSAEGGFAVPAFVEEG